LESAHTQGIEVSVESFFLDGESDVEQDQYVFAYRVRLKNHSDRTVQLISRHWIITDSNGTVRHVKGEGVVGQQPVMAPGEDHQYTSGSQLESPLGTMHGTYQMRDEMGEMFDVDIPVFTLSADTKLI
jgi:ApaG protein